MRSRGGGGRRWAEAGRRSPWRAPLLADAVVLAAGVSVGRHAAGASLLPAVRGSVALGARLRLQGQRVQTLRHVTGGSCYRDGGASHVSSCLRHVDTLRTINKDWRQYVWTFNEPRLRWFLVIFVCVCVCVFQHSHQSRSRTSWRRTMKSHWSCLRRCLLTPAGPLCLPALRGPDAPASESWDNKNTLKYESRLSDYNFFWVTRRLHLHDLP